MKYDFTSIIDRLGNDAIAVDLPYNQGYLGTKVESNSIIPMWVADMNFATFPKITEALVARSLHPTYGYFEIRKQYYEAIKYWHSCRYGINYLNDEMIGYENGVLGGVVSALKVLCSPGDKIIIQSPTYIGFKKVCQDNGYELVYNELIQNELGVWCIDYDDLEKKIIKNKIHVAIFCSPHNPLGRVWEQEEIAKMMKIYQKHDVYVISDEIWSDIIVTNKKHIPTYSISEDAKMRTISFYAPSKTFNLAGLIGAYHIIPNKYLNDRITKVSSMTHYNSINVLSMHALIAAYSNEGQIWVDELCQVLAENIKYVSSFFNANYKNIKISQPQGTYMLFVDFDQYCLDNKITLDEILEKVIRNGIIWQDGRNFNGSCHIRMNLALPKSLVIDACERIKKII